MTLSREGTTGEDAEQWCGTVRAYRPEDYSACAHLWEIAKLRVHTPQQIEALLAGAGGALVAEARDEDGKPRVVGVVLWSHNGDIAMLWRLAVAPEYRKRGIARALIHRAEQDVKAFGLDGICLLTRNTNAAARALYTSEGYTHKEIHEFWGKKLT